VTTGTVRGLGLRLAASPLNERILRLLGPRLPRVAGSGWMPWLVLRHSAPRPLPGPDWLRLKPTLAGICGTDLALLTGRAGAAMSPFVSFPAVLGHEVVGQVVEAGAGMVGASPGDRIVVDPVISCDVRGLAPCRECADGHAATCLRSTEGSFAPGLILGYCRDLPGAWGDEMLVHRSQVHAVPAELDDAEAVLVEPLSVALHAVLRRRPPDDARVLVIGGGALGLLVLASLRLLGARCEVTVLARHPIQATMAERLGADHVVRARGAEGEQHLATAGRARSHRTLIGGRTYSDGFEVVYDCVGNRMSADLSLRVAGPRGRVVTAGGPALLGSVDWTPSWVRELTIEGSYTYGREPALDGAPHTFAVALGLLARHRPPIGELVTHRFGLADWRRAMATNLARGRSGALKTVFDLGR
jgi:threonine dehydrogenase-like Zn-dependent dehydrogenase